MPIEDTYSPMIHRINQAIKQRAVHPDEAVGPAAELLVRYVRISSQLFVFCSQQAVFVYPIAS
jgi:ATP-dependent DNA helicase 2 subunit 2